VVLPKEVGEEPAPVDGGGEQPAGAGEEPVGAEVVTQEPALLNNPALEYPASAYEAGVEGTVRVSYTITEKGEVESPRVARSSGDDRLDRAAVEYVTRLKFQPATRDGQPVAAAQERNVQFSLR
jgi:protein TonB